MEPKIAQTEPVAIELEAGDTVFWCSCGQSANQPYCDGSHAGTPFRPKPYKAETEGTVYFCACKQTKNPPFCDGSHNAL
jgi:CDGSH-type Zn-finger protein